MSQHVISNSLWCRNKAYIFLRVYISLSKQIWVTMKKSNSSAKKYEWAWKSNSLWCCIYISLSKIYFSKLFFLRFYIKSQWIWVNMSDHEKAIPYDGVCTSLLPHNWSPKWISSHAFHISLSMSISKYPYLIIHVYLHSFIIIIIILIIRSRAFHILLSMSISKYPYLIIYIYVHSFIIIIIIPFITR